MKERYSLESDLCSKAPVWECDFGGKACSWIRDFGQTINIQQALNPMCTSNQAKFGRFVVQSEFREGFENPFTDIREV